MSLVISHSFNSSENKLCDIPPVSYVIYFLQLALLGTGRLTELVDNSVMISKEGEKVG